MVGLLGGQLLLAGLMMSGDLMAALPRFGLSSPPPDFDAPTRPGDQTRKFSPRRMPLGPARDGNPARPFRNTGEMPDRLTMERAGDALTLTGMIEEGDSARFAEALDGAEGLARIRLNSPGGSVQDALKIGRKVREAALSTVMEVDDICLSACPYILAAGVERRLQAGAQVGVHQHYFGANVVLPAFIAVGDIQRGQGEVMGYLDAMGVDPLLMQPALLTPSDEIYVLTDEELTRFRLVTDIADGPGESQKAPP